MSPVTEQQRQAIRSMYGKLIDLPDAPLVIGFNPLNRELIAAVHGNFNRAAFKAIARQSLTEQWNRLVVYCDLGVYSGPNITLIKYEDMSSSSSP